ncbi:MAG: energy transducer TonB [Candidatus Sulfotelmatobacter sp.]
MSKLWKFTLFLLACSLARIPSALAQALPNAPPPQDSQTAVASATLPSGAKAPDANSAEFNLVPIETPPATYPPQALERKIQGKVTAKFLVSESGDVEYVEVPKDQPLLDLAAQDAIVKWKFKPVVQDGKPAATISSASFNFVLGSDSQGAKDVAQTIGPASVFPERVQIPKAVAKSAIVHRVPAVYPQGAMAMRVQGSVVLQARIDKDGKIADLQPVSGPKQLVQAAMDAVKQWRYKPYSLLGQPVEVETQVQVDFSM